MYISQILASDALNDVTTWHELVAVVDKRSTKFLASASVTSGHIPAATT